MRKRTALLVMAMLVLVRSPQAQIVVDRHSVSLFDQIPEQYVQAAAALRMFFMDRSVGGNIDNGLNCMQSDSTPLSANFCRRNQHPVPEFSVDMSVLWWSRSGGYNRSNWVYEFWPDAGCGTWSEKVQCFMRVADTLVGRFDVISFQFSYLEVDSVSTIAQTSGGFFSDNASLYDVYDLATWEAQYPTKVFIYWTSSLARSIGSTVARDFNEQMRAYAVANNRPLFDVADILSHTPDGSACYDNRDGVLYDNGNVSENHPDDGRDLPAICQQYTSETEGGHLGSPSAGMIRVAKAFWVLMAQIAGWEPQVRSAPSRRVRAHSGAQQGMTRYYTIDGKRINAGPGRAGVAIRVAGTARVVVAPR